MRYSLPLLLLTAAPTFADTFHTAPRAVSATLYPGAAEVTHHITLSLPAGKHEVLFPFEFGSYNSQPRLTSLTEGVTIQQAKRLLGGLESPEHYLTPAQEVALSSIEAAQDAMQAHEDKIAGIEANIRAVTAQLDFLMTVSAGDLDMTPSDIASVSQTMHKEVAAAQDDLGELHVALRSTKKEHTDLTRALKISEARLARLLPPKVGQDLWGQQVNLDKPTDAVFQIKELESEATWHPSYDIHVSSGQMDRVELIRKVKISGASDTSWTGVDVTLSTNTPKERISPSQIEGRRADLLDELVVQMRTELPIDGLSFGASWEDAPVVENIVVPSFNNAVNKGGGVVYTYGAPIDLGPDEDLHLELDRIVLESDTQLHASPRNDETAFWVAKIQNTTGEPLLEGDANIYRDGVLVGSTYMSEAVAGDTLDLPLGPAQHIHLTYVVKDNQVGERGFITTATSQTHQALVRVENLSSETEDVRVFFPTTYSEQEELRVTVNATPAPTETDFEDRRGVSVWDLNVPAGGQSEISIETTLRWPEGKTLSWSP